MIVIDGKNLYTIEDISNELGYAKGTIVNYIGSGICDAIRMEDGQWFITVDGYRTLLKRKGMKEIPQFQTPSKNVDVSHGNGNEHTVHFTDDASKEVLSRVRELSNQLKIPIKFLTVSLLRFALESNEFKNRMIELKDVESKRDKILESMGKLMK